MYHAQEKFKNLYEATSIDYKFWRQKLEEVSSLKEKKAQEEQRKQDLMLLTSLFNKIIDSRQNDVMNKVISLTSVGLQTILDDPTYELVLESSVKRNSKFIEFKLRHGELVTPILNYTGGGIVNLISFLFRVVLLIVSHNRRFLVLDEQFSNLSMEYREKLAEFLIDLSNKTGVQFLMVSHQEELNEAADVLYRIKETSHGAKCIREK